MTSANGFWMDEAREPKKEVTMNPALITVCFQIASKVGPALYSQLADLLGDQVPSWPNLVKEHGELDAMIVRAEKA